MSEWVGFSDADLQRMKGSGHSNNEQNRAKIVKPLSGGGRQKVQKKQNQRAKVKNVVKLQTEVPPAARLSDSKESGMKETPPVSLNDQIPLHGKTFPSVSDEIYDVSSKADDTVAHNAEPEIVEDEQIIKQIEKVKLEDIQKRQKEMEEKNRRKKTILTKAISERKKKAVAESTKLLQIQSELSKLDGMLNYDVSILRDKIDEACLEFNNAQKRFTKAEAEYIETKMKLHHATEMKEDLTEHLYQLIQLNEERKAKKLEELMNKLELLEDKVDSQSDPMPHAVKTEVNSKQEDEQRAEGTANVEANIEKVQNKSEQSNEYQVKTDYVNKVNQEQCNNISADTKS